METLGQRLRAIRERLGKNQEEVADSLRMGQGMISAFENDKGDPKLSTLRKLADHYRVGLDELFGRAEIKPERSEDELRFACISAIMRVQGKNLANILDFIDKTAARGLDSSLKKQKSGPA